MSHRLVQIMSGAIAAIAGLGIAAVPNAIAAEAPESLTQYRSGMAMTSARSAEFDAPDEADAMNLACNAATTFQTTLVYGVPLDGLPCTVYTTYPELDGRVGGPAPIVLKLRTPNTPTGSLLFAPDDLERQVWQADAIAFETDEVGTANDAANDAALVVYWTADAPATAVGQVVDRSPVEPGRAHPDSTSVIVFQAR